METSSIPNRGSSAHSLSIPFPPRPRPSPRRLRSPTSHGLLRSEPPPYPPCRSSTARTAPPIPRRLRLRLHHLLNIMASSAVDSTARLLVRKLLRPPQPNFSTDLTGPLICTSAFDCISICSGGE